jgi:hypothetical protein
VYSISGNLAVAGPKIDSPLIEHWDGTNWSIVACPNPGGASLTSVIALTASDAWAVGRYVTASNTAASLILKWDGVTWMRVQTPNPSNGAALYTLNDVAATSNNNAWAVGTDTQGSLALHWNGRSWQTAKVPGAQAGHLYRLYSVSAATPNAVWAAGATFNERSGKSATLMLHWSGRSWYVVRTPRPATLVGGTDELLSVSAGSGTSAWAVGSHGSRTSFTNSYPLTIGWNGTKWRAVPSP